MKSTEILPPDMRPGFFFQFGRKTYTVISSYTDEDGDTFYWCKSYREDINIMEYAHVFFFNQDDQLVKHI